MSYALTPVVLIALAGVLMIAGALMGPETRDVELGAVEHTAAVSARAA